MIPVYLVFIGIKNTRSFWIMVSKIGIGIELGIGIGIGTTNIKSIKNTHTMIPAFGSIKNTSVVKRYQSVRETHTFHRIANTAFLYQLSQSRYFLLFVLKRA